MHSGYKKHPIKSTQSIIKKKLTEKNDGIEKRLPYLIHSAEMTSKQVKHMYTVWSYLFVYTLAIWRDDREKDIELNMTDIVTGIIMFSTLLSQFFTLQNNNQKLLSETNADFQKIENTATDLTTTVNQMEMMSSYYSDRILLNMAASTYHAMSSLYNDVPLQWGGLLLDMAIHTGFMMYTNSYNSSSFTQKASRIDTEWQIKYREIIEDPRISTYFNTDIIDISTPQHNNFFQIFPIKNYSWKGTKLSFEDMTWIFSHTATQYFPIGIFYENETCLLIRSIRSIDLVKITPTIQNNFIDQLFTSFDNICARLFVLKNISKLLPKTLIIYGKNDIFLKCPDEKSIITAKHLTKVVSELRFANEYLYLASLIPEQCIESWKLIRKELEKYFQSQKNTEKKFAQKPEEKPQQTPKEDNPVQEVKEPQSKPKAFYWFPKENLISTPLCVHDESKFIQTPSVVIDCDKFGTYRSDGTEKETKDYTVIKLVEGTNSLLTISQKIYNNIHPKIRQMMQQQGEFPLAKRKGDIGFFPAHNKQEIKGSGEFISAKILVKEDDRVCCVEPIPLENGYTIYPFTKDPGHSAIKKSSH